MTPKQRLKREGFLYEITDTSFIIVYTETFTIHYNSINGRWYVNENLRVKGHGVGSLVSYIKRHKGKNICNQ